MKQKLLAKSLRKNEAGVTLVELLASLMLLSIIVTAFLTFFTQAAKTNQLSDRVNEATFIAQEELELMNYYADNPRLQEAKDIFAGNSNGTPIQHSSGLEIFRSILKVTEDENSNLYIVKVEVKEGGMTLAQMETRLPFASEE